ncbi:MAG: type IV pilus secretin PilQ family protein [Gallionellaceae bacterium]|nr:type IV pilus secretin PilQ family protein [Gallionellaceae bacterium]
MKQHQYALRFMAIALATGMLAAHAQDNPDVQNPGAPSSGVPASDVSAAAVPNSIQSLSASTASDGKLVLKVGLKNAPATPPLNFTINTPPRIAFDFPNTLNELGKSVQEFAETELRSANIVQAGTRTRLVLNLNHMLVYDTQIAGNDLLITLQSKAANATAMESSAQFSEAKPSVQKHSLRDVDFHRGKNGEGRVQVDLSDASVGIDVKQQGKNLIVDFIKTSLPRNLQRKLDVTDFGTPIEGIDIFVQGDNVRMIIEPKGLWEHAAYQTDNKFIVEVKPIVDDPNKLVKGKQIGYTGEKLTLNFQNISTREALTVIADFTNLNIVISDTVAGNLTLRLKDVPWDQALDIILQSRGLDMRKNGNVIQVAPREEIASKEKLNLAADQEIADLETLQTESFQLSYAKGSELVALLSNDKQRILSKRGSAVVDQRTNTVFIQDTPTRLEEARKLIKQIDVAVRQVMIEARFVEASDSFNRTIGGRLGFSGPLSAGMIPNGFTSGSGGSNNISLPGASSGTGGLNLSFFDVAASKTLGLELSASELDGNTKSIASPRVVTANGTEAVIESGVEIPYLQASSSGATNVAFKKATLSLKVTPQITPDDNVNMKVDVNQDTVGDIFSGIPSINTKQVSTQVLVENGGTVVIGGVYTQGTSDSTSKVPLLADVPILGWLFKENTKTDAKRELLIFITPKILSEKLNLR